jgi:hypothetical protein
MRKYYGDGNLPMGLYKLVTYDTQSPGWTVDGDYTEYGVYKVGFKTTECAGRKIVSPDGFAKACGYTADDYSWDANGDTLYVSTLFWRWVVSGSYYDSNLYALAQDEGLDNWEAFDVS